MKRFTANSAKVTCGVIIGTNLLSGVFGRDQLFNARPRQLGFKNRLAIRMRLRNKVIAVIGGTSGCGAFGRARLRGRGSAPRRGRARPPKE